MAIFSTFLIGNFLPFLFSFFHTTHSAGIINQHNGFTVELFNSISPHAPTYNVTLDGAKAAAESSLSRSGHIPKAIWTDSIDHITSDVWYDKFWPYTIKLSIGTPPVEFIGIIDTGSNLIWSQCEPCKQCYEQTLPIFDSMQSSTFKGVGRNSDVCKGLPKSKRVFDLLSKKCKYSYDYIDGGFTKGFLASETVTFDSIFGGKVAVPNIAFGCGNMNKMLPVQLTVGGIIGLGRGPLSLVSQLGPQIGYRFSYCLNSVKDSQSTSKMKLGSHANFLGNERLRRTPLLDGPRNAYYLKLQDISVNNRRLSIPTVSVRPEKDSGFFIDSGTTTTLLTPDIYRVLESALRRAIHLREAIGPKNVFVCYKVDRSTDLHKEIPSVTFHFDDDADWPLSLENMFHFVDKEETVLCSFFGPSKTKYSIFGNAAQRNFHVGYDLGEKTLYFAPNDCTNSVNQLS